MKLIAHFYCLNEHFSQEHADAQHKGEESENNYKIEWEDELALSTDVVHVDTVRKGEYALAGELPDGENFSYSIQDMLLFNIASSDNSITQFACSEAAVEDFSIEDQKEQIILSVYLKGEEPCINPIPGIYIVNGDFPEPLIG